MTYPTAGGPGVYPPAQGQPPWTPPPAPPPPRPARRTTTRLALAAAILAAGLGGGIAGSLLTHRFDTTTSVAGKAPSPDDVRTQDIKLCTEYVLITATKPQPVISSRDLVPAVAAVRTSIAAYPDASADLRSALNDVADAYFAELSHFESKGAKGLVDPPKYDRAAAQATYDRAWALCGLK